MGEVNPLEIANINKHVIDNLVKIPNRTQFIVAQENTAREQLHSLHLLHRFCWLILRLYLVLLGLGGYQCRYFYRPDDLQLGFHWLFNHFLLHLAIYFVVGRVEL